MPDTISDKKSVINTFAENVTALPGYNVEVTFSVTDFDSVASISLTIKYNNSILNYLSTEYIHDDINTGTFNINQNLEGDLKIAWYSLELEPVNIGDDDLFKVLFSYEGGFTEIQWDTITPGACVYTDLDFNELPAVFFNGSVSVQGGFEISGRIIDDITLEGVEDVEVTFTGLGSVHTDFEGYYLQSVPMNWSGTSEPMKSYYSFEPETRTYSNVNINLENQDYTATFTPQDLYISGKIIDSETSLGIEGIKVTFTGLVDVYTDQNGDYIKQVPYGWSGFSEPQSGLYVFQPEQIEYVNVIEDMLGQDFVGQLSFSISGLVTDNFSGLGIENVEITFDGLENVFTNSDGYYIISVSHNWNGTAIPVKDGYIFNPPKRDYIIVNSNLENEDYIGTLTDLSLSVSAEPEEICNGYSSQLNAIATGGSGNYSYSWMSSPEGFYSDEASPIVFPDTSTIYIVVVNDGLTTISDAVSVSVIYSPASADEIFGSDTVCIEESQIIYYVDPIQNASEYLWIVPSGVSIQSGSGTNSISVYFSETSASGSIRVRGINQCGIGSETIKEVIVNQLPEVSLDTFENVYVQITSYLLSGGHPEGGVYSGNYIIGDYFYPQAAGVGPHMITYSYTDPENGCINSASQILIVTNSPGINEDIEFAKSIKIYPNPTQGLLNIEIPNDFNKVDISIFSIHGKRMLNSKIDNINSKKLIHNLDISSFSKGIYYIKISDTEQITTGKIILK